MRLYKSISNYFVRFCYLLFIFCFLVLFSSCNSLLDKNESYNLGFKAGYIEGLKDGKGQSDKKEETNTNDPNFNKPTKDDTKEVVSNSSVPQKAIVVLDYIRKNNKAPDGYVGGRHFGNYEHNLPERDAAGDKIDYQEWDIQPKTEGKNRGAQRLITGSDGRAWYTADHYSTFTEVK